MKFTDRQISNLKPKSSRYEIWEGNGFGVRVFSSGHFARNSFLGLLVKTAANYLRILEKLGLLRLVKVGKENYYINKRLFKILQSQNHNGEDENNVSKKT
jgi:hypothetical protein